MHNLAIALHKKGFTITGSDDEIFDPAKTNLLKYGLLPEKTGWYPERITEKLNAVILGMHAMKDNPELARAKELNLKIYSYPEYIYEASKDKIRVVIGGSHGKTTITSMIMHVLNYHNIKHDYMVGAQLEGFETMVNLSHDAKFCIIEGDEYLSSPDDRRPKFHLYKPNIALLSGIAWDHINVFPTFDIYVDQFRIFINLIETNGSLVYFEGDENIRKIVSESKNAIDKIPYSTPTNETKNGITYVIHGETKTPLMIFGEHNLQNLNGARLVCNKIGISDDRFYEAISVFKGASKRLQLLAKNNSTNIFLDFAHSPSKLKATTSAVKKQFPERKLIACMELHTFSSLNEDFLPLYKGAMEAADVAYVYYNPATIAHKRLKEITPQQVKDAFASNNVCVFTDSEMLVNKLLETSWNNTNLLLMSSGNFSGINFKDFAEKIINS
mgnify:CR=1 FL=1